MILTINLLSLFSCLGCISCRAVIVIRYLLLCSNWETQNTTTPLWSSTAKPQSRKLLSMHQIHLHDVGESNTSSYCRRVKNISVMWQIQIYSFMAWGVAREIKYSLIIWGSPKCEYRRLYITELPAVIHFVWSRPSLDINLSKYGV